MLSGIIWPVGAFVCPNMVNSGVAVRKQEAILPYKGKTP